MDSKVLSLMFVYKQICIGLTFFWNIKEVLKNKIGMKKVLLLNVCIVWNTALCLITCRY